MPADAAAPRPHDEARAADALRTLVAQGRDPLPLPAGGRTLERWRGLADVAGRDLSLAKLYEGHTDALAILAELGGAEPARGSLWATWCAEPPDARLRFGAGPRGRLRVDGRKAWCSGAACVTHALVSGWNAAGEPCLAAVAMDQPGVRVTGDGWYAVGMAGSASVDVLFDAAEGLPVGAPHAYLRRPGFWHGGAGIAAVWWGGAAAIGRAVRARCGQRQGDVLCRAHLGSIDVALQSSAALLRAAAHWIDRRPREDARAVALRTRLGVERDAGAVLHHAGRALGAGPLCKDAHLARAMADLPVFMRQSHAEKDLAELGRLIEEECDPWTL